MGGHLKIIKKRSLSLTYRDVIYNVNVVNRSGR